MLAKVNQCKRKIVDHDVACMELAEEMEFNLELVGIVGFKNVVRKGVKKLINTLQKADVKINVLSGDNFENSINCGFNCGILKENQLYHLIDFENESSGFKSIKEILNDIKDKTGFRLNGDKIQTKDEKATPINSNFDSTIKNSSNIENNTSKSK